MHPTSWTTSTNTLCSGTSVVCGKGGFLNTVARTTTWVHLWTIAGPQWERETPGHVTWLKSHGVNVGQHWRCLNFYDPPSGAEGLTHDRTSEWRVTSSRGSAACVRLQWRPEDVVFCEWEERHGWIPLSASTLSLRLLFLSVRFQRSSGDRQRTCQ